MNVKQNLPVLIFGFLAALPIFAVGCSSQEAGERAGGPPAKSTASPKATVAVADTSGHSLFINKGCAACHGQNAEGTTIAPALPGHNEAMVINQVRNPRFQMPAFGPEQISNTELEAIAGFIVNLEGGEHQHPTAIDLSGAVEMHHWMALESLEANDPAEAIHHVAHIIESLDPGEHQDRMKDILASLESGGDTHEPEHQIEEMLAGSASPSLTLFQLHLKQALDSFVADDVSEAKHHVSHAQEIGDDSTADGLAEVRDLLEMENRHGAEHEVREILGLEEGHD